MDIYINVNYVEFNKFHGRDILNMKASKNKYLISIVSLQV